MKRRPLCYSGLLLLLWLFATSLVEAAPASPGPDWRYTVRPGEELWGIAARFCGSSSYAERLAAHNALARPEALRAGTALRIPVAWLVRQPVSATIRAVSGIAQDGGGRALAVGDRVAMGERIRTGEGFAIVVFADGSQLEIGPQSDVLFNILTAFGDTGMVDTHLRFYRGRGAARVVKKEAASRFRIWTPSGIAAVRGTDFRVGTLPAPSSGSRVETVTGAVDFEAGATTLPLPAGFGAVANREGVVRENLLPAPQFVTPAQTALGPIDGVRWRPVAGAARYGVTVYALSAGQDVPVAAAQTEAVEFALSALPAGAYRLGLRAVSARGLEGFSAELAVRRVEPPPTIAGLGARVGPFDRRRGDAPVLIEWEPGPVTPTLSLVALDQPNADRALSVAAGARSLSLRLAPGRYQVAATMAIDGVSSPPSEVEIAVQQPAPRWLPLLLLVPALFAL